MRRLTIGFTAALVAVMLSSAAVAQQNKNAQKAAAPAKGPTISKALMKPLAASQDAAKKRTVGRMYFAIEGARWATDECAL